MTNKERIFHAVTFEAIALALIIPGAALATGNAAGDLAIVGVALSLFTVVWNYVFNVMFDRIFGSNRAERSLGTRVGHSIAFEGGLIFVTVPTIAWYLDMSILNALALEAGFLVFFFFYTMLFNWGYDKYQPYKKLAFAIK